MTNKEIYDAAVANGLEFTYFHGEEIVPEEFEDEIQETFWNMELDSADRNCKKNFASDALRKALEFDANPIHKECKQVPDFITNANGVSEARKAVAYDCYEELRYCSNGYGVVGDYVRPDDYKSNDDNGFAGYFNV